MTAKARFLKKLQAQQPQSGSFTHKGQTDIAAFRQRMTHLQGEIAEWLTDTGIQTEKTSVTLIELLIGGRPFSVPGILLRYQNRTVKFIPAFLYGQGVTGCVEVSLCVDNNMTALCRLYMRSGQDTNWRYSLPDAPGGRSAFCEDAFFEIIEPLLP
ncbi:hypothetical protein GWD52_19605 [Enterobacteriaceae bacterium 4M9]|nr:hypothetical protein [Enterobacteriaceae bacterium 4M9]